MAEQPDLNTVLAQATTIQELGIPLNIVSDLILRQLFNEGDVSVGRFGEVLKLHPQVADQVLSEMQQDRQVEVAKAGTLGRLSYTYRLTDVGSARARDALERSQYLGPMPAPIEVYNQAIVLQAGSGTRRLNPAEVKQAISHLILPENFHRRIGPAINAGTSLFLYGPSGNGKTTVAQAIAKLLAGTEPIWLPYALTVGGQIIQVNDPLVHVPAPIEKGQTEKFGKADKRWGLFQRPAVMVGGELKMEALDLRFDPIAKFYEAPLQLKANGGMFLIDDFGRQQVSPQDLLNRWIVPLESGIDYLRLQTGQSLQVPFRQLIVFATNLDPSQLVDAAFLRRIQMKVEVGSPDEKLFYQIFVRMCQAYNIPFDKDSFLHFIRKWYVEPKRTLQAVHPRDILRTAISICNYEGIQPRLTPELIDEACRTYFVD
ncbi:MAG TPA: ATP-binding protein [Anaerolineales bacterium]|nr:ATP-binding protein [Anaerolineales bacterium]